MSKAFAEKILDSMVDESGHCGGRGMSEKQFNIIAQYLEESERYDEIGHWSGTYKSEDFFAIDHIGNVGHYHVVLQARYNWHMGYAVKSIDRLSDEEYEAQLEAERAEEAKRQAQREAKQKARHMFDESEWIGAPKKRINMNLTLVRVNQFDGYYGLTNIYTFSDGNGNCLVWKTQNELMMQENDDDEWVQVEVGTEIPMRFTIKEHSEYRGTKQTVITRATIA